MHKVACKNPNNRPVYLFDENNNRTDIGALSEWQGELDDRQYNCFLKKIEFGELMAMDYVEPEKPKRTSKKSKSDTIDLQ